MLYKSDLLTATEEHELCVRAKDGDVDARNRVVLGILPLLQREAGKLAKVFNKDTRDLLHEGLTFVIDKFDYYDPSRGYRLSTYFGNAARRRMYNWAKRDTVVTIRNGYEKSEKLSNLANAANRISRLPERGEDFANEPSAVDADVIDMMEDRLERAALHKCVACLATRYRYVIERVLEGDSIRKIGLDMGISQARAQQLIKRSRELLRAMMEKEMREAA